MSEGMSEDEKMLVRRCLEELWQREQNKTLVRRCFEEIWNKEDWAIADELIATDHVSHDPAYPWIPSGTEGIKQLITIYRTAFPDTQFTIEEMVAEGDKVVTRWTARGTYRATSQPTTVSGTNIDRIAGGKIVEHWSHWDSLGLLQQLGIVPFGQLEALLMYRRRRPPR